MPLVRLFNLLIVLISHLENGARCCPFLRGMWWHKACMALSTCQRSRHLLVLLCLLLCFTSAAAAPMCTMRCSCWIWTSPVSLQRPRIPCQALECEGPWGVFHQSLSRLIKFLFMSQSEQNCTSALWTDTAQYPQSCRGIVCFLVWVCSGPSAVLGVDEKAHTALICLPSTPSFWATLNADIVLRIRMTSWDGDSSGRFELVGPHPTFSNLILRKYGIVYYWVTFLSY